jgi:glycosyltransferase involved in cell wall biosynthesis
MKTAQEIPRIQKKNGVNVVGYFTSELGMGELGRIVLSAVKKSRIPYSTFTSNRNDSRKSAVHKDVNSGKMFPLNIAIINADQMAIWGNLSESTEINDLPTIAVWAWEIEDFPEGFTDIFDKVEEIWTISDFARKSIEKKSSKPVFVIPMPMNQIRTTEIEYPSLGDFDFEGPYFLTMFDYQSSMTRKNPLATIEAFKLAFRKNENVNLLVKTINGTMWPEQQELLRQAAEDRKNIWIIDQYLPRREVLGLIKKSLAFISLHRAEGYGLACAEAMTLGRPVIATGYSGNMDFMNPSNSLLVEYELVPLEDDSGAYRLPSRWAEPNVKSAAFYLRKIFDNEDFARQISKSAYSSCKKNSANKESARFVRKRVGTLLRAKKKEENLALITSFARKLARLLPKSVKIFIRRILGNRI